MLTDRRHMLSTASCGFGSLALTGLLGASPHSLTGRPPLHPPKAQRVIFLCMSGGPAQMDTFDYKPQTGNKPHPGSIYSFSQQGQSGLRISELLPETAKHADKLCVLNGMYCDTGIHAQSFLQLHTGDRLRPRPSLGAWVGYGLGTENENMPGFISLNSSRPSCHGAAFLPAIYQGTPIGLNGESMSTATIPHITNSTFSPKTKRRQLDFIQSLNQAHRAYRHQDPQLESVIQSMELGFRMQATAPDLLDLSDELPSVLERYRVGKQKAVGTCRSTDFGRQCLLARRFCEAGVRFIEVNHGSWDQHKNHRRDLEANCLATDAPIAALLQDLEERGLLDSTLVIWGGEFGRPGLVPDGKKDATGHNSNGFTFWLAGAGVKPGFSYGATDPTGARAVDGRVHFRDLHATILHLLGLCPNTLTYFHEGREHRLTGPEGGRVVHPILS
ncbi:MAG: DUF1501 domain-containing protein [Verrucomicrobiota bacterium]